MSAVAMKPVESAVDGGGLRPVQDVAKFLSVSRSKVYQLMESGKLPYVKLGKSRRVRWSDVIRLVESNLISRDEA